MSNKQFLCIALHFLSQSVGRISFSPSFGEVTTFSVRVGVSRLFL